MLKEDLTKGISDEWTAVVNGVPSEKSGNIPFERDNRKGLILPGVSAGENGIFLIRKDWSDYTVNVKAERLDGNEGFSSERAFWITRRRRNRHCSMQSA